MNSFNCQKIIIHHRGHHGFSNVCHTRFHLCHSCFSLFLKDDAPFFFLFVLEYSLHNVIIKSDRALLYVPMKSQVCVHILSFEYPWVSLETAKHFLIYFLFVFFGGKKIFLIHPETPLARKKIK